MTRNASDPTADAQRARAQTAEFEQRSAQAAELERARAQIAELQRSLESCRSAAERAESLSRRLDESSDPQFSFTADGLYTFANRAFAEGVGKPLDEIVGKRISDVFSKDEADKRLAALAEVIRTGKPTLLEVRVPTATGDTFYLTTITPVPDATGALTSAVCSSKNITERKRAQEALREQESRWAFAVEVAGAGVLDWDIQTGAVHFSDRWLSVTGYTREEIVPHLDTLTSLVHPDDLPVAMADVQEVVAGRKEVHAIEHRLKHKKGHWIWVQARSRISAWGAGGEPLHMIGTHTDITERKRAEEALRESEERHRTVVQTAMDGFWLVEHDGRLLEVNETYCRMSGYDARELTTLRISDVEASESPADTTAHIERILTTGESRFESVHRRKDGALFDVEVSVKRSPDESGRMVVFLRDITARKRAEHERAKLEAQLRQAQKMESVGRLAGGVAHDFNNMLAVILGRAELALARGDSTPPLREHLEEIRGAARHSADLTRQLLAFARRQTVAPQVLDLNDTVARMLGMLQRVIGENVRLTWSAGAGLWAVSIDPSQLNQVLANLCVNARDAIDTVGTLVIGTSNRTLGERECATHPGAHPGDYVCLAVRDDGSGMSDEVLAHLFEPFFTTKEVGKGTGLGLATVYGIVEQNRGFIEVQSERGAGTTFAIYLPRHTHASEAPQAEAVETVPPSGPETVLLVEDERAVLALTQTMLEQMGYAVVSASTPREALRLAMERPGTIDLLLSDVVMPEMNGRDLAAELATLHPRTRCLFMSGYAADLIAHHGVLEPGVHFVQKPFSTDELAAKVRAALGERGDHTAAPA